MKTIVPRLYKLQEIFDALFLLCAASFFSLRYRDSQAVIGDLTRAVRSFEGRTRDLVNCTPRGVCSRLDLHKRTRRRVRVHEVPNRYTRHGII